MAEFIQKHKLFSFYSGLMIGGQMKPFTRVLSAFAVGILLQGGVYLYLDQYLGMARSGLGS